MSALVLSRSSNRLVPSSVLAAQLASTVSAALHSKGRIHCGQTDAVHAARQATLDRAFRENPERFVKKPPTPPAKPTAAWINPPTPKSTA